jgi:L-seryl-tRNA(Ser) seleniumtransferase
MKRAAGQASRRTADTWSRRQFIQAGGLAGVLGTLGLPGRVEAAKKVVFEAKPTTYEDNIYTRLLGVRPHVPAHDHITALGGSRMPPEVIQAMIEASEYHVDMEELIIAAGHRVAEVTKAEAGLVTSGSFSALLLGAAACLTGTDKAKMDALPHPTWERIETLVQKAHRFTYDRAYRAAGMKIVEVETREQFLNALGPRTAMLSVLARAQTSGANASGIMTPEETLEIGRKAGVPVIIDAASELPPVANLTRFTSAGFDLVVISGGKGMRGPQGTGILAGRADLIEAARLQLAPFNNIGRGMKVPKEEIVGFIAALNRYEALDHAAVFESWSKKAKYIADKLQGIPGLTATYKMNDKGFADVELAWDDKVIPLTAVQAREKLKAGQPRIVYQGSVVRTRALKDGEEEMVARRLRQFFREETRRLT